jgi:hypothetical protein
VRTSLSIVDLLDGEPPEASAGQIAKHALKIIEAKKHLQ